MSFTFNNFDSEISNMAEEINSTEKLYKSQAKDIIDRDFHLFKNEENLFKLYENFQCIKHQDDVDEYQVEMNQIAIDDLERKVEAMEKVINFTPLRVENEQRFEMFQSAINLDAEITKMQSYCGILESAIKNEEDFQPIQLYRVIEKTFNQIMKIESKFVETKSLQDENQLKIEGILHEINKNPRKFKFFNDFCQ